MKRNNLSKDRKKRDRGENRDHPKHTPYVRCPTNKAALTDDTDDIELTDEERRDTLNLLLGDWNANGL